VTVIVPREKGVNRLPERGQAHVPILFKQGEKAIFSVGTKALPPTPVFQPPSTSNSYYLLV
jgi:hypothetical protein